MKGKGEKASTIDEYLAGFEPKRREKMQALRKLIHELVPGASEGISYGMPAFEWKGVLAYFAAYEKHIGFYPAPVEAEEFKEAFVGYKIGRGSIQFPLDREIPWELVRRIVLHRASRNESSETGEPAKKIGRKAAEGREGMEGRGPSVATVDEYIGAFPKEVRAILEKLRKIVRDEAPGATERISYGLPAFEQDGPLLYFGAFPKHIGLYPTPEGIEAFKAELSGYKSAKGSVQFPLADKIPYELVREIAAHRVEVNVSKAAMKAVAKGGAKAGPKAGPKAGRKAPAKAEAAVPKKRRV